VSKSKKEKTGKRTSPATPAVEEPQVVESSKNEGKRSTRHSPGQHAPTYKGRKITAEAKRHVLQQLAQWTPYQEIVDQLKARYSIELSYAGMKYFAQAHREEVEAVREDYLREFNDTPLAFRKVRVQRLAEVFNEAIGGVRDKASKTRGKSFFYALESLKLIREEMEPIEVHLGKGSLKEVEELIAEMQSKAEAVRQEEDST